MRLACLLNRDEVCTLLSWVMQAYKDGTLSEADERLRLKLLDVLERGDNVVINPEHIRQTSG